MTPRAATTATFRAGGFSAETLHSDTHTAAPRKSAVYTGTFSFMGASRATFVCDNVIYVMPDENMPLKCRRCFCSRRSSSRLAVAPTCIGSTGPRVCPRAPVRFIVAMKCNMKATSRPSAGASTGSTRSRCSVRAATNSGRSQPPRDGRSPPATSAARCGGTQMTATCWITATCWSAGV